MKNTPASQTALKVLFAASEADPLVKVGGLGDVAGSLPNALKNLSTKHLQRIDIRVVIPFHSVLKDKYPSPEKIASFPVQHKNGPISAEAYQLQINGLVYYLIDGAPIQKTKGVYGNDPELDGEKYTFFSLALLEMAREINWIPDILHANDWHAAVAIYAIHTSRHFTSTFFQTKSVLSIHNLPFMGSEAEQALTDYKLTKCKTSAIPDWGCKQPLPLGIFTANHIVTVSPTYALEIMTPEFGCGMEDFIKLKRNHVSGILNGLDIESWDPVSDQSIPAQYTWKTLNLRQTNKQELLKEFDLKPDLAPPLIIIVSRLFHQKGIDLALSTLRKVADRPWQAIILGTGETKLENACKKLEKDYPDRVRAAIRFDLALSRRMYAGADMILMPSRYEPCGLSQMIAMRYGCIPVARATGGLKDTIIDNPKQLELNTGFLFEKADTSKFAIALQRALDAYQEKTLWHTLQINGMNQDFSWARSALQYAGIYENLRKDSV
jgi:starch synthase